VAEVDGWEGVLDPPEYHHRHRSGGER
jgi:hypothetical protein